MLRLSTLAIAVSGVLISAGAGWAECPTAEGILDRLADLDLDRAARSTKFGLEPPIALYEKALASPGRAMLDRSGKLAQAVLLATYPLAPLWRANNDADRHPQGLDRVGRVPVDGDQRRGSLRRR